MRDFDYHVVLSTGASIRLAEILQDKTGPSPAMLALFDKKESPMETDFCFKWLQDRLEWGKFYGIHYRNDPRPWKDFSHAVLHISKALGKLAALCDQLDHEETHADEIDNVSHKNAIADIVICAIRAANTFPGGTFSLAGAIVRRVIEKHMLRDG